MLCDLSHGLSMKVVVLYCEYCSGLNVAASSCRFSSLRETSFDGGNIVIECSRLSSSGKDYRVRMHSIKVR